MAQAHEESFFCWDGNTLVVNILGKPGASKDAVGKPKGAQLKVSVTAQPHNGVLRTIPSAYAKPVSLISKENTLKRRFSIGKASSNVRTPLFFISVMEIIFGGKAI
jgi:hypothetical protein